MCYGLCPQQEGVKLVKGQGKLDLMKQLSRGDSSLVSGKATGTDGAVEKSPVVLLINMVGPDELDDSLGAEVQEECSKFGKVRETLELRREYVGVCVHSLHAWHAGGPRAYTQGRGSGPNPSVRRIRRR